MAVTFAPILAVVMIASMNEGPSQDAKSVAIDATLNAKKYQSAMDVQREEQMLDQRSREYERELIQERRARAKARAEAQAEREAHRAYHEAEAEAATQAATRETSGGATSQSGSSNLPELLLVIRSHESGGNYQAYNDSGSEGYGCGGAYQLHANYASGWAAEAGYSGMSPNAAEWSPEIQDAVALYKFNQTNGGLWCDWTDYC